MKSFLILLSILSTYPVLGAGGPPPSRTTGQFHYTHYTGQSVGSNLPPIPPMRSTNTRHEEARQAWIQVSTAQNQFESTVEAYRTTWEETERLCANITNSDEYDSATRLIAEANGRLTELTNIRNQAHNAGAHNFQGRGGGGSVTEELDDNIAHFTSMVREQEARLNLSRQLFSHQRSLVYEVGNLETRLQRDLLRFITEQSTQTTTLPNQPGTGHHTGPRQRSQSPSLESSYPELILLPVLQRLTLPIAERIVQIGIALEGYRDVHDYPIIRTPYGEAVQDMNPEAISLRTQVEGGQPLYRIGTRQNTIRGDSSVHRGSNTGDNAQFWSSDHPNSPGYAQRYGIPQENISEANFIETATMRPNSSFIIRRAPGVGANEGGAYEIVIPEAEGTIETQSHSSL